MSHSRSHDVVNTRLVLISGIAFLALSTALLLVARSDVPLRAGWLGVLSVAQALWLYRLYVVAHEAVHRKLFPGRPWLNDLIGSLALAPIGAPLGVYRKVHAFHHGSNRKDPQHAALDHFKVSGPISPARRLYYRAVWTFYVFAGGFFLHSLITIVLFLVVPTRLSARIDPVFARWTPRARLHAWLQLLPAAALHGAVVILLGGHAWVAIFGVPLLLFAWVWSLLLYVYHYATSVGPAVRFNVRALPRQRFWAWLLLNFNEHVTHHADPSIPWHQLPQRRLALPDEFQSNQNVTGLAAAIWQQRKGPFLCQRRAKAPS